MDQAIKTKWVEALRSGKYQQAREMLHPSDGRFCCLGVLCDVAGAKWEKSDWGYAAVFGPGTSWRTLPHHFRKQAGLTVNAESTLVDMNDGAGFTFPEIADFIEREL